MKKVLLVLLYLLTVALPAAAQDTACTIDLASTAASLVQAQASASTGDTAAALAQIAQARAKLEAIEALCGADADSPDVPPTPDVLALTQTAQVTSSMAGGAIFEYPQGWALLEDQGNIWVASSAEILDRDFDTEPPPFAPGESLIFVSLSFADQMGLGVPRDATPSQVLDAMAAQVPSSFGTVSEPETVSVNDRPAGLLTIEGADADLRVLAVQLSNLNGEATYVQLLLLTAPDELDIYYPTLLAVAESMRLIPGP